MGSAIAIVIALSLMALVMGTIRWIWYALSGKLTPLASPYGPDDPGAGHPTILVDEIPPDVPGALSTFVDQQCDLHRQPYCALTVFRRVRPPSALDTGTPSAGADVRGRCLQLACAECVTEARRWRAFAWQRHNQALHPQWASAALYPFLVKSFYIEVDNQIARPLPGCDLPPSPQPFEGRDVSALAAALLKLKECGSEVAVFPDLSLDRLREVLGAINAAAVSGRPLLADDVLAIATGLRTVVFATDAVYEGVNTRSITRTAYADMHELAVSERHGLTIDGRRLADPFFRTERKRQFAAAAHRTIMEARALVLPAANHDR